MGARAGQGRTQVGGGARRRPSYIATERAGGFLDGLKGSNWKLATRVNGGWSVEKGNTAAMDLLQANPGINAIYASSDYMALGAALAAKSLGRTNISIFGYDGDTGALEDIANGGGVTATTNTSPVGMGRMAALFALDLLNKKSAGGYVGVPTQIVHKGNVQAVLRQPADLFPKPSKAY